MANSAIKITNIPVANLITLNSKFLSVESDIDRTQLITANDLVTYLANTALYKNQVNTTFELANSAYNIANISLTQANSAYNMANISLSQANVAFINANLSFARASASLDHANLSFIQANSAFNRANLSYTQANSAYDTANISFIQSIAALNNANLSYTQANSAYDTANISLSQSSAALDLANLSYAQANSAFNYATLSFDQANSASINANLSFTRSSTALDQANLSFDQANAAFNRANLSYTQANSAYDTANIAYEVANSVISIQAFDQFAENANTALLISQIAYQQANVAYSTANTKLSSSGGTITGPVEISSSLLVTGNVTFSGNVTSVSANNLVVQDNMIYLNEGLSGNTNPDIGITGAYYDTEYHHAGFFRDASDGIWKVFDNYKPEPDESVWIDTSNSTFRIADFQANTINASKLAVNGTVNTGSLTATTLSGNGTGLTSLNANNISSGIVSTARLASGTANSSAYLAGDNTWKAVNQFVSISDIGLSANQIPINQYLGSMAYQDSSSISVTDISVSGNISGSQTFSKKQIFSSSNELGIKLSNLVETANVIISSAPSIVNYDIVAQSILFYTSNSTTNCTINLRGSSTKTFDSVVANGECLTFVLILTNGSTAYTANSLTVDNVAITPKWQGGLAPIGNPNGIDSYTYSIIKSSNTSYTILGCLTNYA